MRLRWCTQALPFWSHASLLHLSLLVCVRNAAVRSRGAFAMTGLQDGSRVVRQAPMPGLDLEAGPPANASVFTMCKLLCCQSTMPQTWSPVAFGTCPKRVPHAVHASPRRLPAW